MLHVTYAHAKNYLKQLHAIVNEEILNEQNGNEETSQYITMPISRPF